MSPWKKYLSYLLPMRVAEFRSSYSGILELSWEKGKLVLNSSRANYSHNHLHQVLKGAMKKAGIRQKRVNRVLNLGLGAGSSIHILRDEWGKDPFIRSVEIDPLIIDIADKYFDVDEDGKHEIIHADALTFLEKDRDSYDLYLIDLFIDDQVNTAVLEAEFIQDLLKKALIGAHILLNTMVGPHTEGFKADLGKAGIAYETYRSRGNEVFIFKGK